MQSDPPFPGDDTDLTLDGLYRMLEVADINKRRGGHYKCLLEDAANLLEVIPKHGDRLSRSAQRWLRKSGAFLADRYTDRGPIWIVGSPSSGFAAALRERPDILRWMRGEESEQPKRRSCTVRASELEELMKWARL